MPGEGLSFFAASFALLAGFFLQAALMMGPKSDKKKFKATVLASTFVFILSFIFLRGKLNTTETGSVVIAPLLVFLFFLLAYFMEDMLPAISVHTILLYTIFYWFVLFSSVPDTILAAMSLIPTLCVLYMAVRRTPSSFYLKLFSYAWFLAVVLFLMAFQTRLPILFESGADSPIQKDLLTSTSLLDISPKLAETMLSGMFILQQVFYLAVVIYLIQAYKENQPAKQSLEELKKRGTLLTSRLSNYRMPLHWSVVLAIFQILALSLNYFLKFIPGQTMIALLALFSLQPIRGRELQELPGITPYENLVEKAEKQKTSEEELTEETQGPRNQRKRKVENTAITA